MKMSQIQNELLMLSRRNRGLLMPKHVLDYARDKNSSLHDCFEWNNGEAAEKYRLWQARQLISIHVTVLRANTKPVHLFVSMRKDRQNEGGYRLMSDVMDDKEMLRQLVSEFYLDMMTFKARYKAVLSLNPKLAGYVEKAVAAIKEMQKNKQREFAVA